MKQKNTITKLIIAIAIGVVALSALCRYCSPVEVERVIVEVPLAPTIVVDSTPTTTLELTSQHQRQAIEAMQHTIDSLRYQIRRRGGRLVFRTDTLIASVEKTAHGAPDTIKVECDETNRTILFEHRPAARLVEIQLPSKKAWLSGFAFAGARLTPSGVTTITAFEPRIGIGASISASSNVDVLLGVETTLTISSTLQTMLTADVRYTF